MNWNLPRQMFGTVLLAASAGLAAADTPQLDFEHAYGVSLHRGDLRPGDLRSIKDAGFGWVRLDLPWAQVEKRRGVYDFSVFDKFFSDIEAQGLRALVILAYGNPLYAEPGDKSPFASRVSTVGFRQAYAAFSAAAVARYAGHGFLWEQWNEPNNKHSWPPAADSGAYVMLMKEAGRAIREKCPQEVLIGPASSFVDLPYIEACLQGGMLDYWSAITIHPYRETEPEVAAKDYARLRALIAKYAPPGKTVPIICGEWGYSTAWRGYDDYKQADFLTRMFQLSQKENIPLTIWYDWRDDGDDPHSQEHRFGLVRRSPKGTFDPKPAYFAARRVLKESAVPTP